MICKTVLRIGSQEVSFILNVDILRANHESTTRSMIGGVKKYSP